MSELPALKETDDAEISVRLIRALGQAWVILIGIFALDAPVHSTETKLLISYGLPHWMLGAAFIFGGVWLVLARIIKNWVFFALGDFIIGTICLIMAAVMAAGTLTEQASGVSIMLWLLPAGLFELHCVLRARWK